MKILIIGGNGNISWHCTNEAIKKGYDVWVLNRGISKEIKRPLSNLVKEICADLRNFEYMKKIVHELKFDVIVDFICYTPEQAEIDIKLFSDKVRQFFFISSTAVYNRPNAKLPFTEKASQENLEWKYSINKSLCEKIFFQEYECNNFPVTIIRPAHTYDIIMPSAVGKSDWTIAQRLLDGKPIVLHGDGTTLWTVTHSEDFAKALVGLFGNINTVGEDFHITSDEWLTWRQIINITADVLNVKRPDFVYVSSDYINKIDPSLGCGIIGHKAWCDIYDNSKIKLFLPSWETKINFYEGIERTINWFKQNPRCLLIDQNLNNFLDNICEKFKL